MVDLVTSVLVGLILTLDSQRLGRDQLQRRCQVNSGKNWKKTEHYNTTIIFSSTASPACTAIFSLQADSLNK